MARLGKLGKLRPAPVGMAIALWDVWHRLTPKQRKQVLALARKHGPKVAARIAKSRRR
jgi:hypothetical protein